MQPIQPNPLPWRHFCLNSWVEKADKAAFSFLCFHVVALMEQPLLSE